MQYVCWNNCNLFSMKASKNIGVVVGYSYLPKINSSSLKTGQVPKESRMVCAFYVAILAYLRLGDDSDTTHPKWIL